MNRFHPMWLYVLFLTLVATATDEFVIAGVLPAVARDLGVSVAAAGQLVTVFAVVYALGAPTLAVAFERFPKRAVMLVGLAVFVAANAGAALASGYWMLMAVRVLAALSAAIVTSAVFTTAATGAPEGSQGRYLGVAVAGMTVALFTGVPVGAWLSGTHGWRAAFWLIAIVGAVAALGLSVTAPRIGGNPPAPFRRRIAPLSRAAVLRLVTVTFLAASGGLMFYSYLSAYVAEVAAGSSELLSTVLFVVGVAGLAGALLAGRFTDSLGARSTLRVVIGGHAVALVLASGLVWSGVSGAAVLVVVVGLWSVFAWALNPPIQASIMAAAGPEAGMSALAFNISGLYLGTGVAGALGGAVIDIGGVEFVPLAGVLLLGSSFLLTLPGSKRAAAVSAPAGDDREEHRAQHGTA